MIRAAINPALLVLAVLLLLVGPSGELWAHGGLYRGPSAPGPPIPGGPSPTAGPVAPGTGGPGAGPSSGAVAAARKNRPRIATASWEVWWEFNKEPYLNLRARLSSKRAVTGLGDLDDQQAAAFGSDAFRPVFSELEASVLPALRAALDEDDPDIVDSAVLALARVTPADRADAVLGDIVATLRHENTTVKRSAILALGILGSDKSVPTLLEVLSDTGKGRRALALKRAVGELERATAAVSLGLIGDPSVTATLVRVVERTDDSDLDLRASTILALGMFGEGSYDIVPFLTGQLGERNMNDIVGAQIPIALGRLGEPAQSAVPRLVKLTKSRKTRDAVKQSAVLSLGRLAQPDDTDIVDALIRQLDKSSDDPTRHFSLVALGEIGARAASDPERYGEVLERIQRKVLRQVVRPKKKSMLPFACTAAALIGREHPQDSQARAEILEQLGKAWRETRNPEFRAAIATSLGLAGHRDMAFDLFQVLESSGNRELNGHVAVALGLLADEQARDLLLESLTNDNDPDFRVQAATALGLMGDADVADCLVDELSRSKTLFATASVARALGRVGGRRAIDPLIRIVQDDALPGLTRAFGCVALGLLAEKTPLPWNARMSVGANYVPAFFVQTELLDIL